MKFRRWHYRRSRISLLVNGIRLHRRFLYTFSYYPETGSSGKRTTSPTRSVPTGQRRPGRTMKRAYSLDLILQFLQLWPEYSLEPHKQGLMHHLEPSDWLLMVPRGNSRLCLSLQGASFSTFLTLGALLVKRHFLR